MKKINFILTIATIALTACSNGTKNGTESISDSVTPSEDSVMVETTATETFTTPDLTFAEVKGHVKKITELFDNKEYTLFEFDEKGTYKSGSRLEIVKNIKRDKDNYIIGGDNGYFIVKWEDGKVKQTIFNESDGTLLTDTFSYNEDGNLIKTVSSSEGPDGDYTTTLTYSYDSNSFDENGNWVTRTVHSSDKSIKPYQEKRKIYYE